ncbi:ferredoxin [Streptomyces stramineus]|uniref:Ferredoxin n=1 Tax=Streptomyces stramineus TaxID=173861 RepID=A0ABP3K260_9ACTN
MDITIDRERCVGAGMCALTAPEVYDQDEEEGLAVVLTTALPPHQAGKARLAAALCPAGAITVHDT